MADHRGKQTALPPEELDRLLREIRAGSQQRGPRRQILLGLERVLVAAAMLLLVIVLVGMLWLVCAELFAITRRDVHRVSRPPISDPPRGVLLQIPSPTPRSDPALRRESE